MDEGLSTTGRRLLGYALRWGQPAFIGAASRRFSEFFERGAFSRSIAAGKVALCLDHDRKAVIARQQDGSLHIVEDAFGLRIDAMAADTDVGDIALNAVRGRGRAGLSIGFERPASKWIGIGEDRQRIVTACDLIEVSIVRFPAYKSGEVHAGKLRIDTFEARWCSDS